MTKALQNLINQLQRSKVKQVREKKERTIKRIHRCLSLVQQKRIVLLYFGEDELAGDFSTWQPVHSLAFVSRYFGINRATVHQVIKRFAERGAIVSERKNAGRPMHYRTDELEALIKTTEHL